MSLTPPLPPSSPAKKSSQELPMAPVISAQPGPQPGKDQAEPAQVDEMVVDIDDKQTWDTRRSQVKTPELQTQQDQSNGQINSHLTDTQRSPSTPGHIPPFDWEEFEARYERALAEANDQEKELLGEFDQLVKYFNIWASASSAHDNERAVKRLQTRQRFVKIAEQSLDQKKQHLTEVVRAFQSALALLSQA